MKKNKIRPRECKKEIIKLDQLYATINEEGDVKINGSMSVTIQDFQTYNEAKVYANLCNKDGAILYVCDAYKHFKLYEDAYYSFSMFCMNTKRFFDPDELAYIEVYTTFNEDTK